MFRGSQCFVLFLSFITSTIVAGPKIRFDVRMIDARTVVEGKSENVKANFTVKNIGNEP
jgi:hypothetical protein